MDGWITIGTKLETDKFDQQIADLENKIKQEEEKQEININVKTQLEEEQARITEEARKLAAQYEKAANEAERLQNVARTFKAGSVPRYMADMEYDAQAAKVDQINAKLEEVEAKNAKISEKIAKNNLQYQTSVDKVASLNGKITLTTLKARELELKAQQVSFKEAQQGAANVQKQVANATKQTQGMRKEVNNVSKGVENMQKGFSGTIHKIGKLALAVLSIRSAYSLVRQAASTLGQYDKQYATDLEYIRFVIAQGIAPVLRKVVELVQTLMAYVNYLVQRLFGVNLFANATASAFKNAKDSMSGMAKSSKEIKNNLAAFDEINVLQEDNGSEGALMPSLDIGGLEDVEIPEWLERIGDILQQIGSFFTDWDEKTEKLKTSFEGLKGIAGEFATGLKQGLADANTKELEKDLNSIGTTIKNIFTDPKVTSAAKTFTDKIALNLGKVTGSGARIGTNFATLMVGSVESYITNNEERIKDHLVTMFDIGGRAADITGNFAVALADISDVFNSQEAQDIGGNIIAMFTNPMMSIQELLARFGTDVYDLITKPFIDNKDKIKSTIEPLLEPIKNITETTAAALTQMGDKMNEVYINYISPFINNVKEGLSDTFGKFLDIFNEHISPVLDKIATRFNETWEKHLKPLYEKWSEFMGKVMELMNVLWENILKPFIDWYVANVYPMIAPVLEALGNVVATIFDTIFDYVGNLFDALGGIIDFLIGVFSGDWERAWEGIKEFFGGIWGGMYDIVKGVINLIIDLINGMIGAIEKALNLIADKVNQLQIVNPFNGEEIWSPNVPRFDFGRIPRLAQGGIVAKPTHAIIGESGKEAVMPLENNTEWIDMLADRLGSRSDNITIRFTGSTAQLVRLLKPELEKEDKRTGKRLIVGGAY